MTKLEMKNKGLADAYVIVVNENRHLEAENESLRNKLSAVEYKLAKYENNVEYERRA